MSNPRKRFQIFVVDAFRNSHVEEIALEHSLLDEIGDVSLRRVDSEKDLLGLLEGADALIGWNALPLGAALIEELRSCRVIVRPAVGFDNIDIRAAAAAGIPVYNVPDYGTEEVADHAMALILSLVRKLRDLDVHVRGGGWDWRVVGRVKRLRGSNLGILGFGRIGSALARRAQPLGLNVGFFDPFVPSGVEKSSGVHRYEELDELVQASDIISLHLPLNESSRGLIGERQLSMMRAGAILVNTSRGEVVDQQALIRHVQLGRIGPVGLDVLANEPNLPEELRTSDRVLLTAHSAFYSNESLEELRRKAAMIVRRVLLGFPERNLVNSPVAESRRS